MFIAILGACGGSTSNGTAPAQPAETTSTAPAQAAPMAAAPDPGDQGMMCPFADSGVDASVEEVEGGSALTLTTDPTNGGTQDQVAFLRDWAEDRAAQTNGHLEMQGEMQGQDMQAEMDEQGMDMNGQGQSMMTMIPPAETTATDVPDGVVLTIRAKRPEDVSELREQVSEHAEMIREGNCPMLMSEPMEAEPMEPMEAEPMEPMEADPMETDPMEADPIEAEPMEPM